MGRVRYLRKRADETTKQELLDNLRDELRPLSAAFDAWLDAWDKADPIVRLSGDRWALRSQFEQRVIPFPGK